MAELLSVSLSQTRGVHGSLGIAADFALPMGYDSTSGAVPYSSRSLRHGRRPMKLILAIAALAAATSVAFAEPYGLPGSGLEAHYMDGTIGPNSPSALPQPEA